MKVPIKYLQSETAMSRLLQSQIRSVRFYFHLPHNLLISLAVGKHYLRCTNTSLSFLEVMIIIVVVVKVAVNRVLKIFIIFF